MRGGEISGIEILNRTGNDREEREMRDCETMREKRG